MSRLNIKVVTWSLGIFAELSYLLCVLYGLIVPETMHMTPFLEIALPGFTWLTMSGFAIGAVESFLDGVYAGLVFTPIYNFVDQRWGSVTEGEKGTVAQRARSSPPIRVRALSNCSGCWRWCPSSADFQA